MTLDYSEYSASSRLGASLAKPKREGLKRHGFGVRFCAAAASLAVGGSAWLGAINHFGVQSHPSKSSNSIATFATSIKQNSRADDLLLRMAPDLGEPKVPELRPRPEAPRSAPLPLKELPVGLQRIHSKAAEEVIKGFRVGLSRVTVVVPNGVGDGAIGARVIRDKWKKLKVPPFKVLVVAPEAALQEAEVRYKGISGDGLFVVRLESGNQGTDLIAQALVSCSGLVVLCSYKDVPSFVRAHRRVRGMFIDLAIFESAHMALGADSDAREAVLNWDRKFRARVLQSLFITVRSLENDPVKGFEEATMEVPGTPTYRVVARPGGPSGPEVYSLPIVKAQNEGITVPFRLIVLSSTASGVIKDMVGLHDALGLEFIETIPDSSGGPTDAQIAALNGEVQRLSKGACKVTTNREEVPDAFLVAGQNPNLQYVLQALGRLSFKARRKQIAYLLIPGSSSARQASAVAWRALSEYDVCVAEALRQAAIVAGQLGRKLEWEDLPTFLREIVSDSSGCRDASQSWVVEVVNSAINNGADEWDVWYGHLLAYRSACKDPSAPIPIDATIHGRELGKWVAEQFLEWRWGNLDTEKQERLMLGGVSLEEESMRSFADGLAAFKQHIQDAGGDPYVPSGHFTADGFPLGAWAATQRAKWRNNLLSAEQQYMLDDIGFPPVEHPGDFNARQVTILMEAALRDSHHHPIAKRQQIFRDLVMKYHPSLNKVLRNPYAEHATQFLDGYRTWYLQPPAPPTTEDADATDWLVQPS